MHLTWFAADDTEDGLYCVATLIQVSEGLVLAAGVARAIQTHDELLPWHLGPGVHRERLAVALVQAHAAVPDAHLSDGGRPHPRGSV
jgi:hypothetical protein